VNGHSYGMKIECDAIKLFFYPASSLQRRTNNGILCMIFETVTHSILSHYRTENLSVAIAFHFADGERKVCGTA
jgi:hypothetical protein